MAASTDTATIGVDALAELDSVAIYRKSFGDAEEEIKEHNAWLDEQMRLDEEQIHRIARRRRSLPVVTVDEFLGSRIAVSIRQAPAALLTPAEVASMFRVDPKTVTRWAKAGKLSFIRTLGGHRRYSEPEVHALLGRP